MPTYKLSYFNGMERAEVTRFLFVLGDIEYEDNRLDHAAWATFKHETPYAQMPVLEVDGVMISQSHAIEGFIAKRVGRVGKTDIDYARCHMIVDCVKDMIRGLAKTFKQPEEQKLKKEFAEKGVRNFLEKFNKMLSKNGYFIGDDLTWPDLALYHALTNIILMDVPEAELNDSIAHYPNVQTLMKNVPANEKIAAWMKIRPQTSF